MNNLKLTLTMLLTSIISQSAFAESFLKDKAVASYVYGLGTIISEAKYADSNHEIENILKNPENEKIINKALSNAKFLKNFARVGGATSAALAGYTAGEYLVEYDKNHWHGALVDGASRNIIEPIAERIAKATK